jgi:flagellar basal-body rod protein FlgF
MDTTMYVALSRQVVLQREMDVTANNIANVDTAGFKVESLMVADEPRTLPMGKTRTTVNFAYDTGLARDFSQGSMKSTGSPFDLAIEGQGMFQVSTASGTRFTRDGRFGMDEQGRLTNASGHPVLDSGGGEITLDPTKGAPSVAGDGTISQAGQNLGKIGLVRFASLSALSKDGEGLYRNDANLQPEADTTGRIKQGMVEGSNVQAVAQITKLIKVSRAYEQLSKLMSTTAELSSRSVERLGRLS